MTECRTSINNYTDILSKKGFLGAPLAGVTTPSFRQIVRLFFDGIIFTEMISVEGLRRKGSGTLFFLKTNTNDMPLGVQLFGSKSESYADAVKVVLDTFQPAVIDINMGCPVKKVLRAGSGCAMMKDEQNIAKVIKAARGACVNVPLSIKIRLGWDMNSMNYNEVIKIAHEEGADAVTLHGRTKADHFSGTVRYEYIADAVSNAKLPVIGNGDVTDLGSYAKMLDTGVSGVMVGRGMMKQPWIFEALSKGIEPDSYLSHEKVRELIFTIMELQKINARSGRWLDVSKKYIVWLMKGLPGAAQIRNGVYECRDENELNDMLSDYFSSISDIPTGRS